MVCSGSEGREKERNEKDMWGWAERDREHKQKRVVRGGGGGIRGRNKEVGEEEEEGGIAAMHVMWLTDNQVALAYWRWWGWRRIEEEVDKCVGRIVEGLWKRGCAIVIRGGPFSAREWVVDKGTRENDKGGWRVRE